MNHSFIKYLQQKNMDSTDKERLDEALNQLHNNYSRLGQVEQKFASIFMRDVVEGKIIPEDAKPSVIISQNIRYSPIMIELPQWQKPLVWMKKIASFD